jgi:L-fuculose-phosphate aldolase
MAFLTLNHLSDRTLREQVITAALKMNALGINQGKSGNISARGGQGFFITPTGVDYDKLAAESIVEMRIDDNPHGTHFGTLLPSSEWRFHHDIYHSRNDINAIVHTHSIHATAIAVLGLEIPAFHYMVAAAGGDSIRCAPYATFGTQALSANALTALIDRQACLLAHHGVIACGSNLDKALALAQEVETLAAMYLTALTASCASGKPLSLLDAAEMRVVLDKFRTYGQQP